MPRARQEVRPDYLKSCFRPFKSTSPPTKALMWSRQTQDFQNQSWKQVTLVSMVKVEKSLSRSMKNCRGGFGASELAGFVCCSRMY